MTIQERLKRSNLIMLIVPVVIAGVLLALGLSVLVLLLQNIYLPQVGLTLRDLHDMGEQAEDLLSGLKLFIVLYAVVVLIAGMSHDLKSPLTIIRAYTELFWRASPGTRQRDSATCRPSMPKKLIWRL